MPTPRREQAVSSATERGSADAEGRSLEQADRLLQQAHEDYLSDGLRDFAGAASMCVIACGHALRLLRLVAPSFFSEAFILLSLLLLLHRRHRIFTSRILMVHSST